MVWEKTEDQAPRGILWDACTEELNRVTSEWEKDPHAVAEMLLREWRELPQREKIRAGFRMGEDAYRVTLSRLLCAMEDTSRKIPHPRGFFTEHEDRCAAMTEVGHLLPLLESEIQALREGVALYGRVQTALRELLAALMQVEARWTLFLSRVGNDAPWGERLPLQVLREELARVEGRMGEISAFCDGVSHFCQNTWTTFCLEISKAADIAHKGDGAQIGVLLQVLGAFRGAVDRLPLVPESIQ